MSSDNKGIINYGSIGGNASVENIEKHIGDNITVSGSNINVKSSIDDVRQVVESSDSIDDGKKGELDSLLVSLQETLEAVSTDHKALISEILNGTAELVDAAVKGGSKSSLFKVTAEGLKNAAAVIKDIAPSVVATVSQIVVLIAGGMR